jgi:putative sterol carrier protein
MNDYFKMTVPELVLAHEEAFVPEKASGVNAVIQYRLTGEEGGDWIITIRDGQCTVAQGIAPNPRLTLTASAAHFRDIMLGNLDGMKAFMQGKLKISGDFTLATRLSSFYTMR